MYLGKYFKYILNRLNPTTMVDCKPMIPPDVGVMLTFSSGAVMITFVAIGCVLTNNGIEQKFRGLLLSFSLANLAGMSYEVVLKLLSSSKPNHCP